MPTPSCEPLSKQQSLIWLPNPSLHSKFKSSQHTEIRDTKRLVNNCFLLGVKFWVSQGTVALGNHFCLNDEGIVETKGWWRLLPLKVPTSK
jgi:hypothetical protein